MARVLAALYRLRWACIIAIVFSLSVKVSPAGPLPIAAPAKNGVLSVEYKGGKLSLSAVDADLSLLLKEVAKKSGIQIVIGTDDDRIVTASFKDLSLERGLRKILRGQNYYLFFSVPKKGGAAGSDLQCDVSRVVLLNRGGKAQGKEGVQGQAPVAVTHEASSVVSEIIGELLNDDPNVQARGLERLARSLETIKNIDPEIMGALRLVIGEETRSSGLAGLREILKKDGSRGDAAPTN